MRRSTLDNSLLFRESLHWLVSENPSCLSITGAWNTTFLNGGNVNREGTFLGLFSFFYIFHSFLLSLFTKILPSQKKCRYAGISLMTLHLNDSTKLVHQNVAQSFNHYPYALLSPHLSFLLILGFFSVKTVLLLTQVIWKYMMSFMNAFSKWSSSTASSSAPYSLFNCLPFIWSCRPLILSWPHLSHISLKRDTHTHTHTRAHTHPHTHTRTRTHPHTKRLFRGIFSTVCGDLPCPMSGWRKRQKKYMTTLIYNMILASHNGPVKQVIWATNLQKERALFYNVLLLNPHSFPSRGRSQREGLCYFLAVEIMEECCGR